MYVYIGIFEWQEIRLIPVHAFDMLNDIIIIVILPKHVSNLTWSNLCLKFSSSSKQSIPGITRPPFTRSNSAKSKLVVNSWIMLNFFFSQNFKDNRVHHHYPPAPPILNTPAVHLQILKLHQNLILTEENLMAEFKVHQSRIKEDQTWLTSYQILRSSHLAWRLSQHWTSHTQVRKKPIATKV